MIKIEGISFPGSPFEIDVSQPYATIGSKCWEMTEFGEDRKFGELCRVAISSIGNIAVTDTTNKCIIILNGAYQLKRDYGEGRQPTEISSGDCLQ